MMLRFRFLLVLAFAISFAPLKAQNLLTSRTTSFETQVYKLNASDVLELVEGRRLLTDSLHLHTLVSSFLTDEPVRPDLSPGYYVYAHSDKNQLITRMEMVPHFRVELLNNETDLKIQVYDLEDQMVDNAKVTLGNKRLKYDEVSKSYLKRKAHLAGLLTITFEGHTQYYNIGQQNSGGRFFKRLSATPLLLPFRLAWYTARFAFLVPVDFCLSIARLRPVGTIYSLTKPFRDVYRSIAYQPTGWVRWVGNHLIPRSNPNIGRTHIVLSKPKYLPQDTLRLRLYAENRRERPFRKDFTARLNTGEKVLSWPMTPEKKGVYLLKIPLSDSLGMKLDRTYSIEIFSNRWKRVSSVTFLYSDYELLNPIYKLSLDKKVQHPGVPATLTAIATDQNDLPLADVRLEVNISTQNILKYHADSVFVPIQLWSHKLELDPREPTKITIPDSIFPPVSLSYKVHAVLKNANNEVLSKDFSAEYLHHKEEIKWTVDQGKLNLAYSVNTVPKTANATIEGLDAKGNVIATGFVDLPGSIALNPWVKTYKVSIGDFSTSRVIKETDAQLIPICRRDRDSIYVDLLNPHVIPFSYHLYALNDEIDKGYGTQLKVRDKARGKKTHYLSLQYLWGGRIIEVNYGMELQDKVLNVAIQQPQTIVPGQEVAVKIKVTDIDGDPVEGADLHAYSLTSKFKDYNTPSLPASLRNRKARRQDNHFTLDEANFGRPRGYLEYGRWNERFGLDSIEFYQFIYPGGEEQDSSIYIYSYPIEGDTYAEIAPFITRNGDMEAVTSIAIDGVMAYFSWNTREPAYSFPFVPRYKKTYDQKNKVYKVSGGDNNFKIRTKDKEITIRDLYLVPGRKYIVSVNLDKTQREGEKRIVIRKKPSTLTDGEKQNYGYYTAAYRSSSLFDQPYFSQGNQYFPTQSSGQTIFGPVFSRQLNFALPDTVLKTFRHESGFEYDFGGDIPKMRCFSPENYIEIARSPIRSLKDRPLKLEKIQEDYQQLLNTRRRNFLQREIGNNYGGSGQANLYIQASNYGTQLPLNTLLIPVGDTNRIKMYGGLKAYFPGIPPGQYRVAFLLPGDRFYQTDPLQVLANGTNGYKINLPDSLESNAFTENATLYLEKFLRQSNQWLQPSERNGANRRIETLYRGQFQNGDGIPISGIVKDENGDPLIGAMVKVKDADLGALCDVDGYFRFYVDQPTVDIEVRYIGYKTQNMKISGPSDLDITLEESIILLESVEVVSERSLSYKDAASYSVQAVSSSDISGIAARSLKIRGLSGLTGKLAGVQTNSQPTYFVDGIAFTGSLEDLPKTVVTRKELSAEEAKALFGDAGANGAILLTTPQGLRKQKQADIYDQEYLEALENAKFLRNNFKDDAFWQPSLVTNEDGEASFKTTFPDDITSWRTFALATRPRGYAGQAEGRMRSFKPIMGKLRLPRFLLPGDSSYVIGKGVNYTPDTLQVTTYFEQDSMAVQSQAHNFLLGVVDTGLVIGPKADSTAVTYLLETEDGYKDGELRKIPVFPVGVEETVGIFTALIEDTTLNLDFDPKLGTVTLRAETDLISVIRLEMSHIYRYQYLCNEQAASKLKAYLMDKRLAKLLKEPFFHDGDIVKLIDLLEKRYQSEKGWSWWKEGSTIPWISRHVVEALTMARLEGYPVDMLPQQELIDICAFHLESTPDFLRETRQDTALAAAWAQKALHYLELAELLDGGMNYEKYLGQIDSLIYDSQANRFRIIRLKQKLSLPHSTQEVYDSRKTTLFGNSYWGQERYRYHMHYNNISTTVLAYQILKADSAEKRLLTTVGTYLLEARGNTYYRNTYESIQALEILVECLSDENGKITKPVLTFSNGMDSVVTKFPYTAKLNDISQLKVQKSGTLPVYFTAYQKRWEPRPEKDGNNFVVNSSFRGVGAQDLQLKAGEPVTLVVNVEVKKSADFIMIEVPIPAGCTYKSKDFRYKGRQEVHREYFRHKCSIFANDLAKGHYSYTLELIPQYTGSYTLNPAKAEMMYFPTFFGREAGKRVRID